MPIYSYKCTKCNKEFEKELPLDDRNIPILKSSKCFCEEQHSGVMMRQFGCQRIQFESPASLLKKVPSDFKERLRQIKKGAGKSANFDI